MKTRTVLYAWDRDYLIGYEVYSDSRDSWFNMHTYFTFLDYVQDGFTLSDITIFKVLQ